MYSYTQLRPKPMWAGIPGRAARLVNGLKGHSYFWPGVILGKADNESGFLKGRPPRGLDPIV